MILIIVVVAQDKFFACALSSRPTLSDSGNLCVNVSKRAGKQSMFLCKFLFVLLHVLTLFSILK